MYTIAKMRPYQSQFFKDDEENFFGSLANAAELEALVEKSWLRLTEHLKIFDFQKQISLVLQKNVSDQGHKFSLPFIYTCNQRQ